MADALELGWTLAAYECEVKEVQPPGFLESLEFANWRDDQQARNIAEKEVHNVLRHGRGNPPVPLLILGVAP